MYTVSAITLLLETKTTQKKQTNKNCFIQTERLHSAEISHFLINPGFDSSSRKTNYILIRETKHNDRSEYNGINLYAKTKRKHYSYDVPNNFPHSGLAASLAHFITALLTTG